MNEWIYVLPSLTGPVKVGRTRSPADRLAVLSRQRRERLAYFEMRKVSWRRGQTAERWAQFLLWPHRVEHEIEWFNVSPDAALAAVDLCLMQEALPRPPYLRKTGKIGWARSSVSTLCRADFIGSRLFP